MKEKMRMGKGKKFPNQLLRDEKLENAYQMKYNNSFLGETSREEGRKKIPI